MSATAQKILELRPDMSGCPDVLVEVARLAVKLAEEVEELEQDLDDALNTVVDLVDPSSCVYDQDDYCLTHIRSRPCPHPAASSLIERMTMKGDICEP